MQIKGLTLREQQAIESILAPYKQSADFYYYGSRVTGKHSALSDLDVLVDGIIPKADILKLKDEFENSLDLSFIVNLAFKDSISADFYNIIKNNLIKITF